MLWEFLKSKMQKNPNKRVCENGAEITFEELKKDIDSLKEGSTVKIEDENSTLKAFNAVKNYLTEKEIPFNLD